MKEETILNIKLELVKIAASFKEAKSFIEFARAYQKLEKLILFN